MKQSTALYADHALYAQHALYAENALYKIRDTCGN